MASAVASKGTPLAGLEKLLAEPSGAAYYALHPMSYAAFRHLFGSGDNDDEDESSDSEDDVAVDARRLARDLFSLADLAGPFRAPTTTLGRLLSKLEDAAASSGSVAAARRGWWVTKQDDDAVTLKVAMPGLGKEHVTVRADQNALVITGEEGHKDDKEEEEELRYTHRIELPAHTFKMDQVRAEMKDGLLKVTVPRLKDDERKDVFHVAAE